MHATRENTPFTTFDVPTFKNDNAQSTTGFDERTFGEKTTPVVARFKGRTLLFKSLLAFFVFFLLVFFAFRVFAEPVDHAATMAQTNSNLMGTAKTEDGRATTAMLTTRTNTERTAATTLKARTTIATTRGTVTTRTAAAV